MSEVLDLTTEGRAKDAPRGKKKKERSSPYATVPLPPCKVCGGTATGYHFGVITCEACKAFFRRALIHKQTYKCARNDNCYVVGKKVGNCSACRLRKCFELGMSKGGVRKGRYSIEIRTKAIVEAKASEGKDAVSISPSRGVLTISEEQGPVSVSPIRGVLGEDLSSSPLTASQSSSPSSSLVTDIESDAPENTVQITVTGKDSSKGPLPYERNVDLELLIDALVGCQEAVYPTLAKQYERNLLLQAQIQVYKEKQNKDEVFGRLFGTAGTLSADEYQQIFAETGIDLDDRLAHFNSKGKLMEETISQYVKFAKIVPGFKSLNPKDISNLLKASHLEFWILGNYMLFNKNLETAISWDGTHKSTRKEIEKFFSSEWVDQVFKFADRIQNLELSIEEIVLIRVIVLTYTDRCKLKDRPQVQILQEKFLDCLIYQLSRTHCNPRRRLYKIFDVLLTIRDFTKLNTEENKTFLKRWGFMIHEFPLWKEMLSFEDEI